MDFVDHLTSRPHSGSLAEEQPECIKPMKVKQAAEEAWQNISSEVIKLHVREHTFTGSINMVIVLFTWRLELIYFCATL